MATAQKKNGSAGSAGSPKRAVKSPANAQGEMVDLGDLDLLEKFTGSSSKYEREIDELVRATAASEKPEGVGRKYSDPRAMNSLKKRAEQRGVRLQFLNLPDQPGFVVRVDPDPQPRTPRKKKGAGETGQEAMPVEVA